MNDKKVSFNSIDDYIARFPEDIQSILQEIRATIRAAAPEAVEKIGYQMPTFNLEGNLIYFGAWKHHIGIYPASGAVFQAFKDEFSGYKGTAGSVHFPLDQPMPLELITKIVQFRVEENRKNADQKAAKSE